MVREEKIMVAATVACEARWRCAGCSSVAEAVSGVNEEDDGEKMEVLCGGETVRKMVAQGADSWWWRERWRRRCCANGGRWWRCHSEARWWSENKLPWWLTEMVAAAAVEGGHGG
ncbi:hypothetical protein DEO72_LG3g595 [Vigna unguiculata]|uniref:Uncharacterized protein n=1 Tax=Vigna unguiculata TaxID=3917 RepID=A0A4D6LCQ3_VIGUN|nr:hypothetical protein DEO72_LG3g595 [Vigna unguiculata]